MTSLFEYPLDSIRDLPTSINLIDMARKDMDQSSCLPAQVYLWGTQEVARRLLPLLLHANVEILGVFDTNPTKWGKDFMGYTVEQPHPTVHEVILCSYNLVPHMEFASSLIGSYAKPCWEIVFNLMLRGQLEWNCLRLPAALTSSEITLAKSIYSRLGQESKVEFAQQFAARHFIGVSSSGAIGAKPSGDEYFSDDILDFTRISTFLDLGAYTGDTATTFMNRVAKSGSAHKVIVVDADFENYTQLLRLASVADSQLIPLYCAVNDVHKVLNFQTEIYSETSGISPTGNHTIATTVDILYDSFQFDFVKFDIEGAEVTALKGAQRALKSHHAQWAVATYHLPSDLWEIPAFFDSGYDLHVTSYACKPWDTTLYAIPKS